jgi:hypothetical protein
MGIQKRFIKKPLQQTKGGDRSDTFMKFKSKKHE